MHIGTFLDPKSVIKINNAVMTMLPR